MNSEGYNNFLSKLYDMLVRESIIAELDKPSDLKAKVVKVQKYFEKVKRVQDKAIGNDRYLKIVKELYYDRYIIKEKDIPVSYLRSLEKQYLDNGEGHVNLVEPRTHRDRILREQHINNIIRDQKESLDNWLNYFLSPDSDYLPMWAKVWAFQGMLGIGNLNEDKNGYKNRSNVTVNPFVAIDSEILGKCVILLQDSLGSEGLNNSELDKIVKSGNFSRLYGKLLANKKEIRANGTEGIWVKYSYETEEEVLEKERVGREPEYIRLYNSLQGYNTGWCTAGSRETAKEQICGSKNYCGGDFYVYYSKDVNGEYKIPRIAIRMSKNQIGEIRGIAKKQNIESDMESILEDKLREFPDVDNYKQKVSDMKRLTEMYCRYKEGIQFTKEELVFLYQIDYEIRGFGYGEDPRIAEIISKRDKRKDLAFLFDCTEDQICLRGDCCTEARETVYHEDFIFLDYYLYDGAPKFQYVGGIQLNQYKKLGKLELPKNMVRGGINLNGLFGVDELIFSKWVIGNIGASHIETVKRIILPKIVDGSVLFMSLKSAKEISFIQNVEEGSLLNAVPNFKKKKHTSEITGYLKMGNLVSIDELILPKRIGGELSLDKLSKVKTLILPEYVGGDLNLGSLPSAKKVVLPDVVGGSIFLTSLTSLIGMKLPHTVGGKIYYKDGEYTLEEIIDIQKQEELFITKRWKKRR